jgi:hypothetical protein
MAMVPHGIGGVKLSFLRSERACKEKAPCYGAYRRFGGSWYSGGYQWNGVFLFICVHINSFHCVIALIVCSGYSVNSISFL